MKYTKDRTACFACQKVLRTFRLITHQSCEWVLLYYNTFAPSAFALQFHTAEVNLHHLVLHSPLQPHPSEKMWKSPMVKNISAFDITSNCYLTIDICIMNLTTKSLKPMSTSPAKSKFMKHDLSHDSSWMFRNLTKCLISAHEGSLTPQHLK